MGGYSELAALDLVFRPIDQWPGESTGGRRWSNFSTSLSRTVALLARELRFLQAERIVLQVALEERHIRHDGFPRADAKASHPGVILAFESKFGPIKYATDEFYTWEDNLRAIALALEALRAVDRYGVSKRGEQYAGWRALTTGTDDTGIHTKEQAQDLLDSYGGYVGAIKATHPDQGEGRDPLEFRRVMKAKELLAR